MISQVLRQTFSTVLSHPATGGPTIWASPDLAGSFRVIQQDLDLLGDRVNVRKHLGKSVKDVGAKHVRPKEELDLWMGRNSWTHGIYVHVWCMYEYVKFLNQKNFEVKRDCVSNVDFLHTLFKHYATEQDATKSSSKYSMVTDSSSQKKVQNQIRHKFEYTTWKGSMASHSR